MIKALVLKDHELKVMKDNKKNNFPIKKDQVLEFNSITGEDKKILSSLYRDNIIKILRPAQDIKKEIDKREAKLDKAIKIYEQDKVTLKAKMEKAVASNDKNEIDNVKKLIEENNKVRESDLEERKVKLKALDEELEISEE